MSTTKIRKVFNEVKDALGLGGGQAGRGRYPLNWERVPVVARQQRLRECGGEPERYANLYDYAIKRWGSRLPARPLSALVIGCSRKPDLPQILLDTGRVRSVLVVDSDSVVLENLLEQKLPGVECWQMEPNTDPLPRGPFDIVACCDALNHLRELEHIGTEIETVLDRSGLFIAREYVGPNRLQFSAQQMGLVNSLLALIPESYRRLPRGGQIMEQQAVPDKADIMCLEPSRATRSEDIEKMILLRMRIMEEIALGGTILSPLLAYISDNFAGDDPETERILSGIIEVEMRLIRGGMINSDYKAYIARLY